MDELEQEKNGIITLIESWNNENMLLALEILKGQPKLAKLVKAHYKDMLTCLFAKVDLEDFINFPQKLSNELRVKKVIPYFKVLETVLPMVPIYRLALAYDNLDAVPWWVYKMPQLIELNLSNNNIKTISPEIGNLYNLEVLNLTSNLLKEIPEEVGSLSKLQKLQLDFNKIKVLPESIGKLTKLRWLCLEANYITSLPASLSGLESLMWLSIEKTELGYKHNIVGGMYISVKDELFQKIIGT
jgi:hypothetical protein